MSSVGCSGRANQSHKCPILEVVTIAQISVHRGSSIAVVQNVVRSGAVMDTNQRQIALSVNTEKPVKEERNISEINARGLT